MAFDRFPGIAATFAAPTGGCLFGSPDSTHSLIFAGDPDRNMIIYININALNEPGEMLEGD
jgi:hypothetical protein